MARPEGSASPAMQPNESDDVLRAKYFDYCSAQVTDFLLMLPPDEIYVLADQARRKTGSTEGRFSDLVWLASRQWLASLPSTRASLGCCGRSARRTSAAAAGSEN